MSETLLNSQLSAAFRDGVQFVWSATSIKMAETCLRYYQYTMIEGWHSKSLGPHLRFGQHYAHALEHFHKLLAVGEDREEAIRIVVREALVDTWDHDLDDEGNRIEGTGKPWESGHNQKTRETLIRSIIWYLENFKDDVAAPIILSSGEAAVELNVLLDVDDGIMFSAHLDRLAEFAGHQYVMDQKTTGSTLSQYFFNQFSPDTQMSLYTFLGKAALAVPVRGVIIDAAQIAVGFTRFERGMTFRTDGQLNEWYDNAMYHIKAAQHATRENYFPMNTSACGNYGGCIFRTICSRNPDARKNFLLGDFNQGGGYDPLERR